MTASVLCLREQRRSHRDSGFSVKTIWHAAIGDGRDPTGRGLFAPILCGSGIMFPSAPEHREPTCPDCLALIPAPTPREEP